MAAVDAAIDIRAMPADLFVIAIGEDPDLDTLVQMVSPPAENNVFLATTSGGLRPSLRAITDTVCEGGRIEIFQMFRIIFRLPLKTILLGIPFVSPRSISCVETRSVFLPIRCNTESVRDMVTSVFPRFKQFVCSFSHWFIIGILLLLTSSFAYDGFALTTRLLDGG